MVVTKFVYIYIYIHGISSLYIDVKYIMILCYMGWERGCYCVHGDGLGSREGWSCCRGWGYCVCLLGGCLEGRCGKMGLGVVEVKWVVVVGGNFFF